MSNFELALDYLNKGLSVIPIEFQSKKPLVVWEKYQEEKVNVNILKSWFDQWPNAGVAVVLGKISGGLICFDIDPRNGGENRRFKAYKTVIAATGGGGWHYFFKSPNLIHTKPSITTGIDLKAESSYVILPPSVHPNGKPYQWSRSILEYEPYYLPKELIELIEEKSNSFNLEPLSLTESIGVEEGQRNETLYRLACSFINRDGEEKAWDAIEEINRTYKPPLSDHEVKQLFQSARTFIASQKLQITQRTPYRDGSDLTSVIYKAIPLSEISAEHIKIDWLWEGYLALGELTLCSALPKVGKSTLIAHLLRCFQSGEPFAGQEVKKCKTLVISEESKAIWSRKRDDLQLDDAAIWVILQPFMEKPSERQWVDLIKYAAKVVEENGIDLVVIDTITSFWHVRDEGSAPEIQAALLPLNRLTSKNVSVLVVHHHRKSQGDEGTAARGSTAFGSAVTIMLEVLRKEKDNPNNSQRVLRTYSRVEESPPEVVIELQGDKYITLGTSLEVSRQARLDKLLAILPDAPKGMAAQDILDSWDVEELGKKPSRSSINRYLADLIDDGQIKITGEVMIKKTKTPQYGKQSLVQNKSSQLTPMSPKNEERSSSAKNESNQLTALSIKDNSISNGQTKSKVQDPYPEGYWDTVPRNQWPQWKLQEAE